MKKVQTLLIFVGKTLLFAGVLVLFYYLSFVKPKIELRTNLFIATNTLSTHLTNLTQNRVAYIRLTQLEPNSVSFQTDTGSLVDVLQKSQKDGLKLTEEKKSLPTLKDLQIDYPNLIKETENVYKDQGKLLEKVMATESYVEGLKILKSDEAIELLTRETNLILEYQFWLEKMKNLEYRVKN